VGAKVRPVWVDNPSELPDVLYFELDQMKRGDYRIDLQT